MAASLGIAIDWRPFTLDIPSYLGSARLDKQAEELDDLEKLFDRAESAPASAPAAIKATKTKGYRLKK